MPRDRHKKYPDRAPSQQAPVKLSPPAQALVDRIAAGGPEYMMENIERVFIDSANLAEEPEFADITLNSENILEVTEDRLERYEKRLKDAEKKGPDEHAQVFDDVRIEIIDELATPGFRHLVKTRLQTFRDRCIAENNLEKLEITLLLLPALSMKDIPWGICGLVIEIFSRTFDQEMQSLTAQVNLIESLAESMEDEMEGKDLAELADLLESSDKVKEASEKLFAENPELRELAEKQVDEMLDSFEDDLLDGKVPLDLFREDEIARPFYELAEEIGIPIEQWEKSPEFTERVMDNVRRVLREMMTPERYQQLRKDMETAAQKWLRENNRWGYALETELLEMNENEYEDDSFVWTAYFGQINRHAKIDKPAQKSKKRGR